MTLPDERYSALVTTRQFLRDLLDPKVTPKVPSLVREGAARCLRHYPSSHDLEQIASTTDLLDADAYTSAREELEQAAFSPSDRHRW